MFYTTIHRASHRRVKSDHNERVLPDNGQTQNWQQLLNKNNQKQPNKHRDLWHSSLHTFTCIPVTKLASFVTSKIPPQIHDATSYISFLVWIISRIFQTWFKTLICVSTLLEMWVYDSVMAFSLPFPQQIQFSIQKKNLQKHLSFLWKSGFTDSPDPKFTFFCTEKSLKC